MKEKGILLFALTAVSVFLFTVSAFATQNITVMVNGENLVMEQAPILQNNRTLVPMRAIFEALDTTVDWDGQTQSIIASKGDLTIKMTIGQQEMTVNDKTITLDTAPILANNSTMVPVRAVAESFQATVNWDAGQQQVTITTIEEDGIISSVIGSITESIKANDSTELINIKANYPILENNDDMAGITEINATLKKIAADYVTSIEEEYTEEAEAFYQEAKEDYRAYAFEMNVTLSFDYSNMLSGMIIKYENTGGAHPNTIKTGFTYDKTTGKEMLLPDIMVGTQTEIQERIITNFHAFIDKNADNFFEDAKTTIEKEIDHVEFYMAADGIHFFFQLYDIAPYAAGFQEIVIPYAENVTTYVPANTNK